MIPQNNQQPQIPHQSANKEVLYFFRGGMLLKGIHAFIEIAGGILTLFVSQNFLALSILKITHEELSEDPRDFIANYLIHASQNFSMSSQHFVAFYLLSHGIIKGILIYFLLKKKLWSYPLSIFIFGAFAAYQIIRFTTTLSPWLIVFTLIDFVVIWLIAKEYKVLMSNSNID